MPSLSGRKKRKEERKKTKQCFSSECCLKIVIIDLHTNSKTTPTTVPHIRVRVLYRMCKLYIINQNSSKITYQLYIVYKYIIMYTLYIM